MSPVGPGTKDHSAGKGQQQFTSQLFPLSLLDNDSVNTFPQQRKIVGVISFAVRVISKERMGLVLPRALVRYKVYFAIEFTYVSSLI
jgi:hypothetical protein